VITEAEPAGAALGQLPFARFIRLQITVVSDSRFGTPIASKPPERTIWCPIFPGLGHHPSGLPSEKLAVLVLLRRRTERPNVFCEYVCELLKPSTKAGVPGGGQPLPTENGKPVPVDDPD
jgi:hypothetical protein